jgi:hypothetical protein
MDDIVILCQAPFLCSIVLVDRREDAWLLPVAWLADRRQEFLPRPEMIGEPSLHGTGSVQFAAAGPTQLHPPPELDFLGKLWLFWAKCLF